MTKALAQKNETIAFQGKIIEIVHAVQPDGQVYEIARRAPGVRLIIDDPESGKLLLTREKRSELKEWDYRLPGGKVFDRLNDYNAFLETEDDILPLALERGRDEGLEEAGIDIRSLEHVATSVLGSTMMWDLYVLHATKWQRAKDGQRLELGELIEADGWYAYDEVKQMILDGKMQEERIALVLLRWLRNNGKIYGR